MKIEHTLLMALATLAGSASPASAQTLVDLGSAATYSILAGASVVNTGPSLINGDVGVSPGGMVTGFESVDGGLGVVNGTINIDNAAAAQAQSDLTLAYTQAAAESPTDSAGTFAFSDTTLTPGVYSAGTTMSVAGTLTLNGENETNPVFIFQAGSTLGAAAGSDIVLTNGAQAGDVFWQVGSSATLLGGSSTFEGTILALTSITVDSGSYVDGGLLARTGTVTLVDSVPSAIPEPADAALWLAAVAGLFLCIGRFRRQPDAGTAA
jgi:hypothetical protein